MGQDLDAKSEYRAEDFCSICHHRVYNIEKHINTTGHKRNLRKAVEKGTELEKNKKETIHPRLPGSILGRL